MLVQFKLVNPDTVKVFNTLSFVNMPQNKVGDINCQTFSEILAKFNESSTRRPIDFLPYNKSILTRIVYEQVRKQNILLVNHFTKVSILGYL